MKGKEFQVTGARKHSRGLKLEKKPNKLGSQRKGVEETTQGTSLANRFRIRKKSL